MLRATTETQNYDNFTDTSLPRQGNFSHNYFPVDLHAPAVAGLRASNLLSGSADSPYPSPNPFHSHYEYQLPDGRLVRTDNLDFVTMGNPTVNTDIQSTLGVDRAQMSVYYEIDMNGVFRRATAGRFRPYHIYRQVVKYNYTPTLSPMLVNAISGLEHGLSFNGTFNAAVGASTNPIPTRTCSFSVTMVLCKPVLLTCSGVAALAGIQSASLNHQSCKLTSGEFAMGDYQSTDLITLTGTEVFRPKLVIYADDTIASVSASPGGGGVTSIDPMHIISSNGNVYANHTIDKAFVCSTTGHETSFTFTLTGVGNCNQTVTTPALDLHAQLGLFLSFTGVYWWEAYAHCLEINFSP